MLENLEGAPPSGVSLRLQYLPFYASTSSLQRDLTEVFSLALEELGLEPTITWPHIFEQLDGEAEAKQQQEMANMQAQWRAAMAIVTFDQAKNYATTSLPESVGDIVLEGLQSELDERLPSNAGAPRYQLLLLQIWQAYVRYQGEGEEAQTDYVNAKDRLYRDAGWSPYNAVNLERFVLPDVSDLLIDAR